MPKQRSIISNNYHILESDPVAAKLFPRENLVSGNTRGKNLSERISPTNPRRPGDQPPRDNNPRGCFKCERFNRTGKCSFCSHLVQTDHVVSRHFGTKHSIRHHLHHNLKNVWFIYLIEDTVCGLQYIGSTVNLNQRFSCHKSGINKKDPNSKSTSGLLKHFLSGCPGDNPPNQSHLKVTIIDSIKVDPVTLQRVGHVGQHCTCSECRRLKDCEDRNIIALGTFHPPHGLNERNEIRSQVRVNFRK